MNSSRKFFDNMTCKEYSRINSIYMEWFHEFTISFVRGLWYKYSISL